MRKKGRTERDGGRKINKQTTDKQRRGRGNEKIGEEWLQDCHSKKRNDSGCKIHSQTTSTAGMPSKFEILSSNPFGKDAPEQQQEEEELPSTTLSTKTLRHSSHLVGSQFGERGFHRCNMLFPQFSATLFKAALCAFEQSLVNGCYCVGI